MPEIPEEQQLEIPDIWEKCVITGIDETKITNKGEFLTQIVFKMYVTPSIKGDTLTLTRTGTSSRNFPQLLKAMLETLGGEVTFSNPSMPEGRQKLLAAITSRLEHLLAKRKAVAGTSIATYVPTTIIIQRIAEGSFDYREFIEGYEVAGHDISADSGPEDVKDLWRIMGLLRQSKFKEPPLKCWLFIRRELLDFMAALDVTIADIKPGKAVRPIIENTRQDATSIIPEE